MHGAKGGGPLNERNGAFSHGGRTLEAIALREQARKLIEAVNA